MIISSRRFISFASVLLLCTVACRLASTEEPKFEPLFNGKDLTGWSCEHPEFWVIEDNMIIGRSKGSIRNIFLYTDEEYGDFELSYEARLVNDKGNSGVQIRSEELEGGQARGYQVDIGEGYWGSLYHEHDRGMLVHYKREIGTPEDPIKPDGFNHFEVRAVGHRITVKVNGTTTVDLEDPEGELRGRIALQVHSGGPLEIQFRNLRIKKLD